MSALKYQQEILVKIFELEILELIQKCLALIHLHAEQTNI